MIDPYQSKKHRVYGDPDEFRAFKEICEAKGKTASARIMTLIRAEIRRDAAFARARKIRVPETVFAK